MATDGRSGSLSGAKVSFSGSPATPPMSSSSSPLPPPPPLPPLFTSSLSALLPSLYPFFMQHFSTLPATLSSYLTSLSSTQQRPWLVTLFLLSFLAGSLVPIYVIGILILLYSNHLYVNKLFDAQNKKIKMLEKIILYTNPLEYRKFNSGEIGEDEDNDNESNDVSSGSESKESISLQVDNMWKIFTESMANNVSQIHNNNNPNISNNHTDSTLSSTDSLKQCADLLTTSLDTTYKFLHSIAPPSTSSSPPSSLVPLSPSMQLNSISKRRFSYTPSGNTPQWGSGGVPALHDPTGSLRSKENGVAVGRDLSNENGNMSPPSPSPSGFSLASAVSPSTPILHSANQNNNNHHNTSMGNGVNHQNANNVIVNVNNNVPQHVVPSQPYPPYVIAPPPPPFTYPMPLSLPLTSILLSPNVTPILSNRHPTLPPPPTPSPSPLSSTWQTFPSLSFRFSLVDSCVVIISYNLYHLCHKAYVKTQLQINDYWATSTLVEQQGGNNNNNNNHKRPPFPSAVANDVRNNAGLAFFLLPPGSHQFQLCYKSRYKSEQLEEMKLLHEKSSTVRENVKFHWERAQANHMTAMLLVPMSRGVRDGAFADYMFNNVNNGISMGKIGGEVSGNSVGMGNKNVIIENDNEEQKVEDKEEKPNGNVKSSGKKKMTPMGMSILSPSGLHSSSSPSPSESKSKKLVFSSSSPSHFSAMSSSPPPLLSTPPETKSPPPSSSSSVPTLKSIPSIANGIKVNDDNDTTPGRHSPPPPPPPMTDEEEELLPPVTPSRKNQTLKAQLSVSSSYNLTSSNNSANTSKTLTSPKNPIRNIQNDPNPVELKRNPTISATTEITGRKRMSIDILNDDDNNNNITTIPPEGNVSSTLNRKSSVASPKSPLLRLPSTVIAPLSPGAPMPLSPSSFSSGSTYGTLSTPLSPMVSSPEDYSKPLTPALYSHFKGQQNDIRDDPQVKILFEAQMVKAFFERSTEGNGFAGSYEGKSNVAMVEMELKFTMDMVTNNTILSVAKSQLLGYLQLGTVHRIELFTLKDILLGKSTKVLQSSVASSIPSDCCLAIVTRSSGTYHFATKSNGRRKEIVEGIQRIFQIAGIGSQKTKRSSMGGNEKMVPQTPSSAGTNNAVSAMTPPTPSSSSSSSVPSTPPPSNRKASVGNKSNIVSKIPSARKTSITSQSSSAIPITAPSTTTASGSSSTGGAGHHTIQYSYDFDNLEGGK